MTLLPAVNHGDVADHLSLRLWLKSLRRYQRSMEEPRDLLLLLDSDADDEFWAGYGWPVVSRVLAAAGGLARLIDSVAGLPFLRGHEPVGTLTIRQDTADGSFDGYASWAEKWTNQALWTGVERSRLAELHALRLLREQTGESAREPPGVPAEARALLERGFEQRLLALSTTHFGLASPLVSVVRLDAGAKLVASAVADASRALEVLQNGYLAAHPASPAALPSACEAIAFDVFDFQRGVPTEAVPYPLRPSRSLVAVLLAIDARRATEMAAGCRLVRDDGSILPCAVRESFGQPGSYELLFVERMQGGERHGYTVRPGPVNGAVTPVVVTASSIAARDTAILFDEKGTPVSLRGPGCELAGDPLIGASVTWSGRTWMAGSWRIVDVGKSPQGHFAWRGVRTAIELPAGPVEVEREYLLTAELPYVFVRTRVRYPATPVAACRKRLTDRLGRTWDGRWQEVMPCEIHPALGDSRSRFRVWKRNWLDSVTSYDFDYGSFSPNDTVDSGNNHLTAGWVAFSDRRRGLLIGQESARWSSLAFCPVRVRRSGSDRSLSLNPFGTYRGRQLAYPTRATGLGRLMALLMADQLAPDYAGRVQDFQLLLASYLGDRPPEEAARDAEAFAYPFLVVPRTIHDMR